MVLFGDFLPFNPSMWIVCVALYQKELCWLPDYFDSSPIGRKERLATAGAAVGSRSVTLSFLQKVLQRCSTVPQSQASQMTVMSVLPGRQGDAMNSSLSLNKL